MPGAIKGDGVELLVEMGRFDSTKGVILMGATNRPEVLDQALLRAGRFDRERVVGRPQGERDTLPPQRS
jgi:cell division protease FtsH